VGITLLVTLLTKILSNKKILGEEKSLLAITGHGFETAKEQGCKTT